MPKSLEKTRKQIAKKRNGTIGALHQFSRDSKRLHKAQVRDDRLEKLASARRKQDQPLSSSPTSPCIISPSILLLLTIHAHPVDRVKFFQKAAKDDENRPFDMDKIQGIISQCVYYHITIHYVDTNRRPRYVHQYDEEYDVAKKARRPGRPASAREDLLKMKVEALQKEHQNGFCTIRTAPAWRFLC